jgi:hypothetical protein
MVAAERTDETVVALRRAAFHVLELPTDVVNELGSVAIPKAAAKFDREYKN